MRENTDQKNSEYGHFHCAVVITVAISCDFGKTLYLSFRKSYLDQILVAGLKRDTICVWSNLNDTDDVIMK